MIKKLFNLLFVLPALVAAQTFNTGNLRLENNGAVGSPSLLWRSSGDGLYYESTSVRFSLGATERFRIASNAALFRDGTVTAPGISFLSDTNTGLYRIGADNIGITTNGVGRMFFGSNGVIRVGTDTSTAAMFNINTVPNSIAGSALKVDSKIALTSGIGILSQVTAADSEALVKVENFVANGTGLGPGSSITDYVGFTARSNLTTGSYNYGFKGEIDAATGRWNLFMDGTAQNFLAGNLGIGSGKFVPAYALDVLGSGAFSNQVLSGDGTAALPSFSFASDPDTGLYRTGANAIALSTNSAARLRIDSSGRVSISASAPTTTAQFQIDSTTRGFLPPRMTTTQKNNITSPAAGLVVYDTTLNSLQIYNGTSWDGAGGGGGGSVYVDSFILDTITVTGDFFQVWRFAAASPEILASIDSTLAQNGATIEITGTNNTNTITLNNNDTAGGWIINGTWEGYQYSKIVLRWDATFNRWVEVSRNGL